LRKRGYPGVRPRMPVVEVIIMRVLHFVSTLNRNSGVMRVIMNYYTHINRERIQFDFVYFIESDASYIDEIHALGGNMYLIPKPGSTLQSIKALKHFFQQYGANYTWLHNHENYLTVFLYPLAKKYGIQHIAVHAHLTKYSDKKLSAIRNRLLCMPIRYLPVNKIACSKATAQFLYGTEQDVYIMQNMVDADQYVYDAEKRNEIRKQYHLSEEQFVIGHVGRFEAQKNHKFLIELFAEFYRENPDSRLLLVGSGVLETEIRTLVKEKHLEQAVIFAGQQADMQGYLSAMDVFVLPSLFEGLPMVALEAQANGLQCILADTITVETSLSDAAQYCSLNNIEQWKVALQNIKQNDRCTRDLTDALYNKMNFTELAKQLAQYYTNER